MNKNLMLTITGVLLVGGAIAVYLLINIFLTAITALL